METQSDNSTPTGDISAVTFTAALKSLRERSRTLLRQQADRVRNLESRLEQQFASAVERLEQEPREIGPEEQQLFDRVATLERELKQLQQLRRESEQALDEARLMLAELEEERRILRERLDEAESGGESTRGSTNSAAERSAIDAKIAEETERLNRRLELAMQEIRDLKAQNADLAEQTKKPASSGRSVELSSNQFDWEHQKQRLLEQLSSGFDTSDPVQVKEKVRCEEIIRTTDRLIAEKDRQIADLRQQLEERTETTAVDDRQAAKESILNGDELIQAERARLADVQAQWQDKLRQAEIEISIERAKIARERLQMEEKMRLIVAQNPAEAASSSDAKPVKGGRWLSRLGLSGENDKDKR